MRLARRRDVGARAARRVSPIPLSLITCNTVGILTTDCVSRASAQSRSRTPASDIDLTFDSNCPRIARSTFEDVDNYGITAQLNALLIRSSLAHSSEQHKPYAPHSPNSFPILVFQPHGRNVSQPPIPARTLASPAPHSSLTARSHTGRRLSADAVHTRAVWGG